MTYTAQVGLTSDKKGKSWQPGDLIKAGDFPKKIIDTWLEQSILTSNEPEEEPEEIDLDDLFDLPDDELHLEEGD